MSLLFKIRDLVRPRSRILAEIDVREGSSILDFGCGPGSYVVSACGRIGPSGAYYALDKFPGALESIEKLAKKNTLSNVKTILSESATGLADASIDIVFLFDVLHHLVEREAIFQEIFRVLKPEGRLLVNDHHMKHDDIVSAVSKGGFFSLSAQGRYSLTFEKSNPF
ncbi:MAG: hypothetical protein A2268_13705 [Candidatus Raymondbacteria bacterium RifOxyA12_full_50_37]|uniref:Methyltransferase domain-containing protein n=1 Tax=Candidatus Raymondbacteria bacterium RIFOXYD12_FULL_49_13 TaxID=1817890 RepID=A0A1F7F0H7_UNCRA|nr:MAG: hypothetical protein A2248_22880 [Candidatus Raymondbacteria bacterium RIFOXYA2_FULL_49_16]OGJ88413.1 MAG: hypothetical protein A2350_14400 [Candidatus Raymondbacteria bacterium RifOxyB12_full_50_8]OGJ91869.1 MAG: hypothetical protein A2268_13705 [Candidatus Raymondbacteria bacterium RifOxyA12_full_50_37]OGK00112.1 MAG: hypothetical protein A2519_12870 [Candidatus Raymondbacteria bacterium RIFOXYD12_FULL_49_13]OGK06957.1 MAG: hypothetical protein A2487_11175 [Candidatus Raymondbacteria 